MKCRKNPVRISHAEWEIMNVLWDQAPASVNQIIDVLSGRKDWHFRTVRTLLDRLVEKRVVQIDSTRRPFLFSPSISRSDVIKAESESFMKRAFCGEPADMIVYLIKNMDLKAEDLRKLKEMVEEMEEPK